MYINSVHLQCEMAIVGHDAVRMDERWVWQRIYAKGYYTYYDMNEYTLQYEQLLAR